MNLFYFGADIDYNFKTDTPYRRNTWLLKTFIECRYFNYVYILRQTTRLNTLRHLFKKKGGQVSEVYYCNLFPTFFRLKYLNIQFINLLFRIQGVRNFNDKRNIIWIYWLQAYQIADYLNLKGRYFLDTDHNLFDDNPTENIIKEDILLKAAKKCEKIISSSRSMLDWYIKKGFNNFYRLRNGICLKRFENIKPIELDIKKPTIGYVGTLSIWIDYNLFEKLIKNNPDWNFIIYGNNYKTDAFLRLKAYPNTYFQGKLSAEILPSIIQNFDVALNLYKSKKWLDVDSMKIYEYFAANVPVVTTNFHKYLTEDFSGNLFIGNNYLEIEQFINKILNKKYNFEGTNNVWLKNNTWEKRVEQLVNNVFGEAQ